MAFNQEMTTTVEYYASKRVSNSLLSALSDSPKKAFQMLNGKREYSRAMTIGSALDCLLTDSEEVFNATFSVQKRFAIPGVKTKGYLYIQARYVDNLPAEKAIEIADYAPNTTPEKADKWAEPYTDYIQSLQNPEAFANVLFEDEYELVMKMAHTLKTHESTAGFFSSEKIDQVEFLYQYPIYWDLADLLCKSLLDLVIVDHENKLIVLHDLKTTSGSPLDFKSKIISYKYYLQAAFYYMAAVQHFEKIYPEYTVLKNFTFIVISKTEPDFPLTVYVTDAVIEQGTHGFIDAHGTKRKGVIDLLYALKYHMDTNDWTVPYDVIADNFTVKIEDLQYV